MKIVLTVVLVIVTMAVLALVVAATGMIDVAADTPHSGLTAWYLELARESSIEGRIDGIRVPALTDERAAAGASAYHEMCAGCHGRPGALPGVVGRGLNPSPPNLAEEEWSDEHHQAEAFWVLKHGIRMTGMPAFGQTHADPALWDLVAFLERLPEQDAHSYSLLVEEGSSAGGHEEHRHGAAAEDGASDEHGDAEHLREHEHG